MLAACSSRSASGWVWLCAALTDCGTAALAATEPGAKVGIASRSAMTIQARVLPLTDRLVACRNLESGGQTAALQNLTDTSRLLMLCSFRFLQNCLAPRAYFPTPRVAGVPCRPHEL